MGIKVNVPSIDSLSKLASDPGYALKEAALRPYQGLWYTLTSRRPIGTNIFTQEWDLLLVLDACRVDALQAVSSEYDFLSEIGEIWSVGSNSHEWIAQTFNNRYEEEIAETTYITANAFTEQIFETRTFPPSHVTVPFTWTNWNIADQHKLNDLIEVWRQHRDDTLRVVPPRVLTDYTIDIGRRKNPSRTIVHYMQPHGPYIAGAVTEDRDPTAIESDAWRSLRDGNASFETIWEMYIDNLRLVLDDIERLLDNIDAETVVITADHGEAFGEFGAHGHPEGFPHPVVKKVPWVVTTATDSQTEMPEIE